jgi:hypothetical protein
MWISRIVINKAMSACEIMWLATSYYDSTCQTKKKTTTPQHVGTCNHMCTRLSMSEPKIPATNHTLIPNRGTLIATGIRIGDERRFQKLTEPRTNQQLHESKIRILCRKAWLPRAPPKSQISRERFATREAFFPQPEIRTGYWWRRLGRGRGLYMGQLCLWFKRTVRIGRCCAWLPTIGRLMIAAKLWHGSGRGKLTLYWLGVGTWRTGILISGTGAIFVRRYTICSEVCLWATIF